MNIIDLHCDTIEHLTDNKDMELKKNNLAIDLEKLKRGNSLAQFFALFIDLYEQPKAFNRAMDMLNRFYEEIEKNNHEINVAKNYEDINKNREEGKISAFLTIEEGEAIEGSHKNLRNFYDLGVRLMTLTWNYENSIGYPNCKEEFRNKGLKNFGLETVEEMNKLGMIIDVSHLSDGGFYDVARYSKQPFVASHSNSRTICNHSRNLTDDMIRVLSEKGGVTGINFEKSFLREGGSKSSVIDMVKHINHISNIGGIDVVALGSDFDGINPKNLEISNMGEIDKLIIELQKAGYHESNIEKILYKNALRVIKEVL
ncbi:dipeptidase [Clostridium sp. UBA1056]|uniref:dipeptidase n=1 Tax=unclassified Clostridium TaxID=2614128 RepID=UPI003217048B